MFYVASIYIYIIWLKVQDNIKVIWLRKLFINYFL